MRKAPHPPSTVLHADVAETHCATVVFVGDRAYKVKKPLDLGFLDFSTPQRRREACHREVELNRRLAPDVYLGVADVQGPDGEVCEHMVVMRRMPTERRMSRLLRQGADLTDALRDVARQMAVLHAAAPTSADDPAIGDVATVKAVLGNWADNLMTMRRFTGSVLDAEAVERSFAMAERYLTGRRVLLDERIATGMVRDGHGDLMAQDIFCLDDGPRILDCLEFDDRLRYGDVLLDVAFLAMDLQHLGRPDAARRFLADYVEFSDEHHPATLAHHHIAYRAHVRAKVACLRHEQGDPDAAQEARDLLDLSLGHLRRGTVSLTLVGGLPASGKTSVVAALSEEFGWAVLSSDEARKDLHGLGHLDDASAPVDEGLYTPERVGEVYELLLERAERLLERGVPVVVDASWVDSFQRAAAAAVAKRTRSDLVELRCEVDDDVAEARLASRPPGTSASDAHVAVRRAMARVVSPWPTAQTISANGPVEETAATAIALVRQQLHR